METKRESTERESQERKEAGEAGTGKRRIKLVHEIFSWNPFGNCKLSLVEQLSTGSQSYNRIRLECTYLKHKQKSIRQRERERETEEVGAMGQDNIVQAAYDNMLQNRCIMQKQQLQQQQAELLQQSCINYLQWPKISSQPAGDDEEERRKSEEDDYKLNCQVQVGTAHADSQIHRAQKKRDPGSVKRSQQLIVRSTVSACAVWLRN